MVPTYGKIGNCAQPISLRSIKQAIILPFWNSFAVVAVYPRSTGALIWKSEHRKATEVFENRHPLQNGLFHSDEYRVRWGGHWIADVCQFKSTEKHAKRTGTLHNLWQHLLVFIVYTCCWWSAFQTVCRLNSVIVIMLYRLFLFLLIFFLFFFPSGRLLLWV